MVCMSCCKWCSTNCRFPLEVCRTSSKKNLFEASIQWRRWCSGKSEQGLNRFWPNKLPDIPSVVAATGFWPWLAQDHPLCTDDSVLVFVLSHKRVSDWWWWWWWWWWLLGEYPAWIQPTRSCQFSYLFTSFTACTFPAFCHVCSCKMQPMQWEMLPAWPKVCCILRDSHLLTFLIACHWHCSGPAVVPQILNVTMAASRILGTQFVGMTLGRNLPEFWCYSYLYLSIWYV